MSHRGTVPVALRPPLLAAGGLALLGGLYAALVLLGTPVPGLDGRDRRGARAGDGARLRGYPRGAGTRGRARCPVGPARPGLFEPGRVGAAGRWAVLAGRLLLSVAGVALLGVYVALWRRQATLALLAQAAGALAWYAATLLWLGGFPVNQTIPWLAGFVVLTIAGERLELTHVGLPRPATRGPASTAAASTGPAVEGWFLAAACAVLAGAVTTMLWPGPGYHLWGLALLGLAGWLATFDVARHTVRGRGLPRYVAVGLLAGYGWLGVAGLLWAGGGFSVDGSRYDAVLHAVFLGFTMSMIFAHAPVILPAVLRRPLPYHRVLYVPLALLHLSLLARLAGGDLAGVIVVWRWSGVVNEVAVLSFLGCAAVLTFRARRTGRQPGRARTASAVGR
jgi:hypothetical protein